MSIVATYLARAFSSPRMLWMALRTHRLNRSGRRLARHVPSGPPNPRDPTSPEFFSLAVADAMPQMVWSTLPDGFHDYFNAQWYDFTGVPRGSTDGSSWAGMFHPEDRERARARWKLSVETGAPYEIEYRLRHHGGGYRWTIGRALPIRDDRDQIIRWVGTCTDINDRKVGEEQREMLALEMAHRIKNLFALVSALVGIESRQSSSVAAMAEAVQSKIAALAATHSLVITPTQDFTGTANSTLRVMLASVVEPYQGVAQAKIVFSGIDHAVGNPAATALALVFHELATNSVKYGALSVPSGIVNVSTSLEGDYVHIAWAESGGPEPSAVPHEAGFGSRLVETMLNSHLNGSIKRLWLPAGLQVTVLLDRVRLLQGVGEAQRP